MSQRKITSAVVLLHLLVIMTFLFTPQHRATKPHHVVVRTQLTHPKTPSKTIAAARPQGRATSSKKTPPSAKPAAKAAPSKPKPTKKIPKKTTVVETGKKAKPKKLAPPPVEPVEEFSAEEIATKPEKRYSGPKLDIPAPIGTLEIDQKESDSFFSMEGPQDEFISFLHGALHLPDFGEVKIELTFMDGAVSKVVVLKSESSKNKAYLEKQLPLLKFPPREDLKSRTLILTFCNEI